MKLTYTSLADELELAVLSGQLQTGSRLPSLRELSQERGVSTAVAHRALAELCRRQVAESRQGAGFFVAARKTVKNPAGGLRIAVLHHRPEVDDGDRTYCSLALKGIQQEAAENGTTLILHYDAPVMEHDGRVEYYTEHAHEEADAMILLGSYDCVERKLAARVPLVGIGMENTYGNILSPVHFDPWEAARIAAAYLVRKKVRKLRMFRTVSVAPTVIYHAMAACWTGETETWRYMQLPVPPPAEEPDGIGYWFESCSEANRWLQKCESSFGPGSSGRYPLIALNGKNLINPSYLPMDAITPDWIQLGRMALREAQRRVRELGGGTMRILGNVKLVLK